MFRVPQEHDGKGLVCPGCRRLLRLPLPGEETAPLVLGRQGGLERVEFSREPSREPESTRQDAEAGTHQDAEAGTRRRRVRKRRSRGKDKDGGLAWEHDPQGGARLGKVERIWMNRVLIAGTAVLAITVVFLWRQLGGSGEVSPPQGQPGPESSPAVAEDQAASEDRFGPQFLAEAEPMARAFLEAATIEDMAKVVRNPDIARERMLREYPDGRIDPVGMAEFNCGGIPEREQPGMAVILVRTRDFTMRRLNFVDTPDGPRIDWESWAGWCEMAWDDFVARQPVEPKLFRAIIRQSKYYNFDFADDKKWRAFSLESCDGKHNLYGYAERGSPVEDELRLDPDLKGGEMIMVRLRYLPGPTPGNQVLIDGVAQRGWVELLTDQEAAPEK